MRTRGTVGGMQVTMDDDTAGAGAGAPGSCVPPGWTSPVRTDTVHARVT